MKTQTPAEGILIHGDYGDAKHYTVICNCTDSSHYHNLWIEADDTGVVVHTYTEQKTDWWSQAVESRYNIDNEIYQNIHWFFVGLINDWVRRVSLIWTILTKGYIKYEASLHMTEQQAINYAETLKSAVADVKKFRKPKENSAAVKAANEQDCV
jgi:hypothetical protein